MRAILGALFPGPTNPPSPPSHVLTAGHGDSAGIDAKVTLLSWVKAAALRDGELPLAAQSGPTVTASCPAFAFSNASVKAPHRGLNDAWDFPWVVRPFPPVAPPLRAAPVDPLDFTPPLPARRQPGAWGPDPLVFGSGMVLASSTPWRGGAVPARVFGAAQPSERVTITGLPPGAVVSPGNPFTAGEDGNWSVSIASPDSSVGVDLTFAGASGSTAVLRDVLFGVTILCSGQSNVRVARRPPALAPAFVFFTRAAPPPPTPLHLDGHGCR